MHCMLTLYTHVQQNHMNFTYFNHFSSPFSPVFTAYAIGYSNSDLCETMRKLDSDSTDDLDNFSLVLSNL